MLQGASKKSSFAPARQQLREVRKPREVLQYDFGDPMLEQRAMTHTCAPRPLFASVLLCGLIEVITRIGDITRSHLCIS